MAKFLDLRKQPQLEIALPGRTVVLTRKHIPIESVDAHDERISELNRAQVEGEMNQKEFCFAMLAHLTSDFNPTDFEGIDVYSLRDIVSAMNQINLEGNRATEKKSG